MSVPDVACFLQESYCLLQRLVNKFILAEYIEWVKDFFFWNIGVNVLTVKTAFGSNVIGSCSSGKSSVYTKSMDFLLLNVQNREASLVVSAPIKYPKVLLLLCLFMHWYFGKLPRNYCNWKSDNITYLVCIPTLLAKASNTNKITF